jgi:hypothetical protein
MSPPPKVWNQKDTAKVAEVLRIVHKNEAEIAELSKGLGELEDKVERLTAPGASGKRKSAAARRQKRKY